MTFECEICHGQTEISERIHARVGRDISICPYCFRVMLPSVSLIRCDDCHEAFTPALIERAISFERGYRHFRRVCKDCIDNNYVVCDGCHDYIPSDQSSVRSGMLFCRDCILLVDGGTPVLECSECGNTFVAREREQYPRRLCTSCFEERTDDENDEESHPDASISFRKNDENDAMINDPRSEV